MFILNNHDPVPLYRQLYNQMREHILSGKLSADSRLPSVRDMAVELSASRNTVEGAYQELYAEGYIYSKPRSGYFVSALDQDAAPQSLSGKSGRGDYLPGPPANFTYDFHPARLDQESFPIELWRKCFVESLRQNSRQLVQYGIPRETGGCGALFKLTWNGHAAYSVTLIRLSSAPDFSRASTLSHRC